VSDGMLDCFLGITGSFLGFTQDLLLQSLDLQSFASYQFASFLLNFADNVFSRAIDLILVHDCLTVKK
jgi:hypothetical protein